MALIKWLQFHVDENHLCLAHKQFNHLKRDISVPNSSQCIACTACHFAHSYVWRVSVIIVENALFAKTTTPIQCDGFFMSKVILAESCLKSRFLTDCTNWPNNATQSTLIAQYKCRARTLRDHFGCLLASQPRGSLLV